MQKPDFLTDEYLVKLAELDEATLTNMFLSVPYLLAQFPELNPRQAQDTLLYWHNTIKTSMVELAYCEQ